MSVYSLCGTIPLGYSGENEVREIRIDIAPYVRRWPELEPALVARRPGESEVYPCNARREGDVMVWTVTTGDTAIAGRGEVRLHMVDGAGRIGKSAIAGTRIDGGMEGEEMDTPPEAAQPWVNDVLDAAKRAEEAAERAEAAAGTPSGNAGIHFGPEAPENPSVVFWVDTDESGGGINKGALLEMLERLGLIEMMRDGDNAALADADGAVFVL